MNKATTTTRNLIEIHGGKGKSKTGRKQRHTVLLNKERHETNGASFWRTRPPAPATPKLMHTIHEHSIVLEALPFGSRPRRRCFASRRPRTVHFLFGLDLIQPAWCFWRPPLAHVHCSAYDRRSASGCFSAADNLLNCDHELQDRAWCRYKCRVGLQGTLTQVSSFYLSSGGRVTGWLLTVTSRVFPTK
jgi:hypothetical protein